MKIMKRVLALALVCIMVFALASCAKKLSGTYTAEIGGSVLGAKTSYTFSGSKVTVSVTGSLLGGSKTTDYEGEYEITEAEDGSMTITFTFTDSDAKEYSGTYNFVENENSIKIGMVTYNKQ